MLKSAYFQCIGGASGDMVLGALVDAGVSVDGLREALGRLPVQGFTLSCERARRGGVAGTRVTVDLDAEGRRSRRIPEFIEIVEESGLEPRVVERSCAVFRRLGEAESSVHGMPTDETVLHELGTLDTLVDVVGAMAGLEMLGVDQVYASPLPSGSGMVDSGHGKLPVPAPATAALFALARAPVVPPPSSASDAGEMVTPTGAAIITSLATFRQPPLKLERVGYGLGSRDPSHYPNVLALWVGEEEGASVIANLALIETNIDDMSGEMLGYVQERLFDLGARDVWFSPIQMKKNRPGTLLSALVPVDLESRAVDLVLIETSTLGVRVRPVTRYEADRESVEVPTSLGTVAVKIKLLDGRRVGVSPEYEACRRIAREKGLPLQEVYRVVEREAGTALLGH